MRAQGPSRRRIVSLALGLAATLFMVVGTPAQQWVTETRDPQQTQDEDFA